jgi:hypothetical protein
MRHERHAGGIRHLKGDVERRHARGARRVAADANLDADDHVLVGERHLDRLARRHHPHLLALAHHHVFLEKA